MTPAAVSLRLVALAVALACLPLAALADPADDLVRAMQYPEMFDSIATTALASAVAQAAGAVQLDAGQRADLIAALQHEIAGYKGKFLGDAADYYRQTYSADEIAALDTFYDSVLGKKVLAEQNDIHDRVVRMTADFATYLGSVAAKAAVDSGAPLVATAGAGETGQAPQDTGTGNAPPATANAPEPAAAPAQPAPVPSTFHAYYSRDMSGPALDEVAATTVQDCANACHANASCVAFTLNVWNKLCFLRAEVAPIFLEPAAVSGIRADQPRPTALAAPIVVQHYNGKAFPGDGYHTIAGTTQGSCEDACTGDDSCVVYSYSTDSEVCTLFNQAGEYSSAPGVNSGAKRQLPPG